MTRQFVSMDWDRYAECYDVLNTLIPYRSMLQDAASALPKTRLPVLDAGCGTGNLIGRISNRCRGTIVGIDASPAMLKRAKAACAAASLVRGDLGVELPFQNSTFGAVVCVNALYAIERPLITVREFFRVLRPGGTIVLITPKQGYENGLILKAHCKSMEPEAFWLNAHSSAERERMLIREAIHDAGTVEHLLCLAEFNRKIAREQKFHFFTAEELSAMVFDAGFERIRLCATYAEQNLLMKAERTPKGPRHDR